MQTHTLSLTKRLQLWRRVLRAPPDMEVVTLIVASLPHDEALCQAMPRHGFWFNKTRQLMKVDPKELRRILVKGREAAVVLQLKHKSKAKWTGTNQVKRSPTLTN